MAKECLIIRDARGKLEKNIDKEFDNVVQQIEKKFNSLTTGKTYVLKNITEKRTLDPDNSTFEDIVDVIGTILKDLQSIKILLTKVE